ncbi:MAG: FAD-dependent oxidoreductase [Armatimonadota bacterium]
MIEDSIETDVVVVGGGLAGTFAAIASARMGCETVLIQDRPVLGGNASSEILVGIGGADFSGSGLIRYARETGLMGEYALEMLHRSTSALGSIPLRSVILWEMAKREKKLTLLLNTSVRNVYIDEDGSISAIKASQLTNEKELVISGRLFVDCTGHGSLGALAGARFRMGREARDEFDESLAPESADKCTMGDSLYFRARDLGRPVPFTAPSWAKKFPTDDSLPFRHPELEIYDPETGELFGFWWIEYGGMLDVIDDAEDIYDELMAVVYGIWDHMKNAGDHGVANYELTWISPVIAPRESRRLVGDYIIKENDIRSGTLFDDRVAYGGWPIDIHPPEGMYSKEPPCIHDFIAEPCSVPFRALYSKDVPNLLFAGRDISVTHVALGTLRVMATCAVIGQAAGTAAALCSRHNTTPRELAKDHIHELQQQLLDDDCYIVEMRKDNSGDLIANASIRTSSEAVLEVTDADEWHELSTDIAQMFPVSGSRLDKVGFYMLSGLEHPVTIEAGLREANTINDFKSKSDVATASATVHAANEALWVEFDFNVDVEPEKFYCVHLSAQPGVYCAAQTSRVFATNRAVFDSNGKVKWRSMSKGTFRFRNTPLSRPYGGSNVQSGVNRPEKWTNCWISDPHQALPQSIEIEFDETKVVSRVDLIFDPDLDRNIYWPPPYGRLGSGMVETIVRDYVISLHDGSGWKEAAVVVGNYQRCRSHTFADIAAKGIRVDCLATHGSQSARIYEIRAFGPKKQGELYEK